MTKLDVPDTAIATAATALLTSCSPGHLVNHCLRTFEFGLALARRDHLEPDRELFYVAAALHDLGLTKTFDGPRSFEEEGAEAAHGFLLRERYPRLKADLVAEAVRLHLQLSTATDPRPEVALVHIGASADVTGARLDDIPTTTVHQILDEFPRLDFSHAITLLLTDQVNRKPTSQAARLVELGILQLIAAAPFSEYNDRSPWHMNKSGVRTYADGPGDPAQSGNEALHADR